MADGTSDIVIMLARIANGRGRISIEHLRVNAVKCGREMAAVRRRGPGTSEYEAVRYAAGASISSYRRFERNAPTADGKNLLGGTYE